MRNLKFRMWNYEGQKFEYNLAISDCSWSGAVEYQQFTGLEDSQGNEVYEGDILRWQEHQDCDYRAEGYYVVKWDEEYGRWAAHDPFNDENHALYDVVFQNIVGNIFEDKSLLPCEDDVD